jgi:hypothetical protein
MPSGTIKIGLNEYDVRTNGTPRTVEELSNIPLKQVNGTTIYLRDVARVSDGFQVQTNIVRQDGLVSVLKNGISSTLDIVFGIRKLLPRVASIDHFTLCSLDGQKKLLDETVRAYQDALQVTQDRYDGGTAPLSDVARARTQFQMAQSLGTRLRFSSALSCSVNYRVDTGHGARTFASGNSWCSSFSTAGAPA